MTKTFKVYHIICEGSSEEAYLKELNKYLRSNGFEVYLKLYNLYGIAEYSKIKKKYRNVRRCAKKTDKILAWLDNDVFKRGKLSKDELRRILGGFYNIKYNYENFEDFLVMHLSDEKVNCWQEICRKESHFSEPMNNKAVAKFIHQIFSGYSKGSLPGEFQINAETLERLNINQEKSSVQSKSDFVEVIRKLLQISV